MDEFKKLLSSPDPNQLRRYGAPNGLFLRADECNSNKITDTYYGLSLLIHEKVNEGDIVFIQDQLAPIADATTITPQKVTINPAIIGSTVTFQGRVLTIRDQKERAFLRVQTQGANCLQIVVEAAALKLLSKNGENMSVGHMIEVSGKLQSRYGKKRSDALPVELVAREENALSWYGFAHLQPATISLKGPSSGITLTQAINAITAQGGADVSMRHPVMQHVMTIGSAILNYWVEHFSKRGYVQFASTTLLSGTAEGGAAPFVIKGYNIQLAQSPQLEKEVYAISLMRPVFATAPAFRNDPSNTRVHLPEFLSLDAEIPNLLAGKDTLELVTEELEQFISSLYKYLQTTCAHSLNELGIVLPQATQPFTRITFEKGREVISQQVELAFTNPSQCYPIIQETIDELKVAGTPVTKSELSLAILGDDKGDLSPKGEKLLIEHATKLTGFPAVYVISFPRHRKPFYIQPDGAEGSRSFDLLLTKREIVSGGERVSRFEVMEEQLRLHKLMGENGQIPESLQTYYSAIKMGAPRHGGFGLGFERLLHMVLNGAIHAKNIRPMVPYPMDLFAVQATKPGAPATK